LALNVNVYAIKDRLLMVTASERYREEHRPRSVSDGSTSERRRTISDYKLFESSLRKLLGAETANTILTFLHDEIVNSLPRK
jgi:hypothetical protein